MCDREKGRYPKDMTRMTMTDWLIHESKSHPTASFHLEIATYRLLIKFKSHNSPIVNNPFTLHEQKIRATNSNSFEASSLRRLYYHGAFSTDCSRCLLGNRAWIQFKAECSSSPENFFIVFFDDVPSRIAFHWKWGSRWSIHSVGTFQQTPCKRILERHMVSRNLYFLCPFLTHISCYRSGDFQSHA